jgi:hypothetical protein
MRVRLAVAALLAAGVVAGCGARPTVTVVPAGSPTPAPASALSPSPAPTATPTPPAPARATFTATVVSDGGANIRAGPGMDSRVVGLVAKGSVQTFDGWYRHADDPPQPDATSGRIEAWSRDWYHLANGAGWIHSSTLSGFPPAGMPQMDPIPLPIVIQ